MNYTYHDLRNAINLLKIEYDFKVYGIKPNNNYKGLDDETLETVSNVIKKLRHKIWDKKFWNIGISSSICACACPVDGDLKRLDKVFSLHEGDDF